MEHTQGALFPITEVDLPLLLKWRNTASIREAMYNNHEILREEHYSWFKRTQTENYNGKHYLFKKNDIPLGVVNFTDVSMENKRLSWGFYIGNPQAPRGTGTLMGIAALDLAFLNMGMHKVCGEVLEVNKKSMKYHERLGFEREGFLREHICRDNHYLGIVVYGLLYEHWISRRQALLEVCDPLTNE